MSFAKILSQAVILEEHFGPPEGSLFPEEIARISAAAAKRRNQFACGRSCARRALARLGQHPVAIPIGSEREPLWPSPVVGSITHCDGYCAAAVARREAILSVGIDAECIAPIEDEVLQMITRPEERSCLERLAQSSDAPGTILLFCLKEALFKAWYPIARTWLDFGQAAVFFEPDSDVASVRVLHPNVKQSRFPERLKARYAWNERFVFSAVELPQN